MSGEKQVEMGTAAIAANGRVDRNVRRQITEDKMDIVEEMRGFEIDHEPEGWPGVRMRQVSALCDEIERLRKICMTAKEALYSGSKDDLEVADMLEAVFLTPNA